MYTLLGIAQNSEAADVLIRISLNTRCVKVMTVYFVFLYHPKTRPACR
jgi:hypothetical protein